VDVPRCLSFTVSGNWAHFKQPDGNHIRRTYRTPPRTTLAGLIAAILGYERDSYYGIFQSDNSAFAVSPVGPLRTTSLAENILTTNEEAQERIGRNRKGLKLTHTRSDMPRQRRNFEVVHNPAYRIDCWLADDDAYDGLKTHLENETSVYTPALGLSEFLADIEYHGDFTPEPVDESPVEVSSVVPGGTTRVLPAANTRTTVERAPALMEKTKPGSGFGPGRRTTAFADIAVETEGRAVKTNAPASRVDDRNVVFF
jgi:CRISPR-associated protein Cas5h